MENRKKLGIFIIIIGLLIIAAIIYFIFIRKPIEMVVPTDTVGTTTVQLPIEPDSSTINPGDRPRNYQQYDISKEAPHETGANDVAKLAASFAERLGSFSNQSDYSNFDDLSIFMTETMRTWSKEYVAKMRTENPYNGTYYGITTKSISTEVKSFDEDKGAAEVIIVTSRREVKLDGGENNYQQNLRLVFAKQNDQWLVDGAYWEK